jgi:hypothetical protein
MGNCPVSNFFERCQLKTTFHTLTLEIKHLVDFGNIQKPMYDPLEYMTVFCYQDFLIHSLIGHL